jgi:LSD1 subclass zinc finger protein
MAVQVVCPNLQCRKLLSVPDEVRGKQVKCQYCQTTFRVPTVRKPAAAAAAAGPAAEKK